MRANFLPAPSLASTFLHNSFILIAGGLACLSPLALSAQSVTFAGTQTTLPTSDLVGPFGVAVDSAGDIFVAGTSNGRVVELPRTAAGYGPQTTLLPFTGSGIAVDSAGDVFVAETDNNRVVELPKTTTGYGPLTTLPTSGLRTPYGVAVDSAGDVFIADLNSLRVVELPKTATGYGPQTILPASGLVGPIGVAVDSAGDVFIADSSLVELPRTATGYGPQTTLATSGLDFPSGVAVDSTGNVFFTVFGTGSVVEVQTRSVNFEGVNVCAPGQTTPAPCNETLTLNFKVNDAVTLGTPKALTGGAPDLDFTLASGSTCTGSVAAGTTCTVNVTFTPLATGTRNGSVQITDGSGNVLTTTLISGYGVPATVAQFSANPLDFGTVAFGSTDTLPLTITNIGQSSFTLAPSIDGQS